MHILNTSLNILSKIILFYGCLDFFLIEQDKYTESFFFFCGCVMVIDQEVKQTGIIGTVRVSSQQSVQWA